MTKHTFILNLTTDATDWNDHLSDAINQLCSETNGTVEILELNEKGAAKVNAVAWEE